MVIFSISQQVDQVNYSTIDKGLLYPHGLKDNRVIEIPLVNYNTNHCIH